jgi:hypothetical protein
MKALVLLLGLFFVVFAQSYTRPDGRSATYSYYADTAYAAHRSVFADSGTGAVHTIAADSAYKTRDTLGLRLGIHAAIMTTPLIAADSATVPKLGGTVKTDTINSIKGIKAPIFTGAVVGNVTGSVTGTSDSAKSANHCVGGLFNGTTVAASGTATVDSLCSTKAVKCPALNLHAVLIDSLKILDATDDTLYIGQGGKLWKLLPITNQ